MLSEHHDSWKKEPSKCGSDTAQPSRQTERSLQELPRHAVDEVGDCAGWCLACDANIRAGLNPDGSQRQGGSA